MKTTEITRLGQRIKALRKMRGLTQDQLAERVGVDSKHISRLEMSSSLPMMETLAKIADAMGVSIKDFFEPTDAMTQKELLLDIKKMLRGASVDELRVIQKFVWVVRR